MKQLLLILLLLPSFVNAGWQDWTNEQQKWFIAANVVTLADWATTRDMARRYHEGYKELNPILGKHPNITQVDRYFATGMVLNYFLVDWLQGNNRTFYLKVYTMSEGFVAARNLNIGLELKF